MSKKWKRSAAIILIAILALSLLTACEKNNTFRVLTYPDMEGMTKDLNEDFGMATYNDDDGNITLQLFVEKDPTDAQLAEANQGWGSNLEELIIEEKHIISGEVTGSHQVDLAGLNVKGLELDVNFVFEGIAFYCTVIPLDTQLGVVIGYATDEFKDDLRTRFDELIQGLAP